MSCRHYKNEILESVRTAKVVTAEVNDHLKQCDQCREYESSQIQLTNALQELNHKDQTLSAPAAAPRLLEAVRQKEHTRLNEFFWMKAAAIFIVSVLCGSYWIYKTEYRQNAGDKKTTPVIAENPDDYLPLTYGMAQDEPLQRIRVKLPRSALDDFGIRLNKVRSEEITADVIVGESGIPYAIRVVQ